MPEEDKGIPDLNPILDILFPAIGTEVPSDHGYERR